jgi:hypothetical protein
MGEGCSDTKKSQVCEENHTVRTQLSHCVKRFLLGYHVKGETSLMPSPTARQKPLNLFYSYAHKDETLRNILAKYLWSLRQEGVIKEWHDRDIRAGEKWDDKIDEHLESADIILLLISVDFMNSGYIWGKELTRALERHNTGEASVIPIIVRPVDWTFAPFASLQALPKDGKAVVLWRNKEVAWVDVAKGIKEVAAALVAGLPIERAAAPLSIMPSRSVIPARPSPKPVARRSGGQLRRTIYDAQNGENLPGTAVRGEGDSPNPDSSVNEAYDGLGAVYQFFWDVYGRNSLDDKGMPLEATVHYGQNFNNAFWNGKQIVFGDGDGELFNRFTNAIDVIAWEITKGVIQAEAKLAYWHQSGALISSLGSVFGCLVKHYVHEHTVDQADWLVGVGLFTQKVKARALYSIADPGTAYNDPVLGTDPQPAHMRAYVHTTDDNGGVHINAGIPNRAFYLVATALGSHAWERAGRIWYDTLRDKELKSDAQFRDFAQLTLTNAHRLYGANSDEAQAVMRGWELVGIKMKSAKPAKVKRVKPKDPKTTAARSREKSRPLRVTKRA